MPITPEQFQAMQQRLAPKTRLPAVPEDAVEDELPLHSEIIKWCREQYPKAAYIHSRTDKKSRITKGAPDFVIGFKGKIYLIECKKKNGKRDLDQLAFALLMELQGIVVHVCHSMSEFREIISPRTPITGDAV